MTLFLHSLQNKKDAWLKKLSTVSELHWVAASTLFIVWALVFLGHSWEANPKMDAMTYGVFAKNILKTGDWKTLHYTHSAFPNFYDNPPFIIWLQAIVFYVVGASDLTLKIIPAFFGLGTLLGIVVWGRALGSLWLGYCAALILMTSGRYIKYASDFFLDGPLVCFIIWGLWFAFKISFMPAQFHSKKIIYSVLLGLLMSCAFMTKGTIGLTTPFALIGFIISEYVWGNKSITRHFIYYTLSALIVVFVLGIWLTWGGGWDYALSHWNQSHYAGQTTNGFLNYLAPFKSLIRTYWPWLPFYIWGLFLLGRERYRHSLTIQLSSTPEQSAAWFIAITSFIILIGFCTVGSFFLEHYLVPFYPFAALIAASTFKKADSSRKKRIIVFAFSLSVICCVFLAVFPIALHTNRNSSPLNLAMDLVADLGEEKSIDEIIVYEPLDSYWNIYAVGLWKTPWHIRATQNLQEQPTGNKNLFFYPASHPFPPGWKESKCSPCFFHSRRHQKACRYLKILEPLESTHCNPG